MAGVIEKFLLASMLMWLIPVAVLYGFNHNVFPGPMCDSRDQTVHVEGANVEWEFSKKAAPRPRGHAMSVFGSNGASDLSPHSLTLWSGLLAVISVNAVIGFYIYLAMKEPADKHEPDPSFLAQARASIQKPIEPTEGPSQPREKDE